MDRNKFKKLIEKQILILDGATGTELQKRGYLEGTGAPEELNLKYPEKIGEIHKAYLDAGADVILANTFGANRLKLADYGLADRLDEVNQSGVKIAKSIAKQHNCYVAANIGPIGAYLIPLGSVGFDSAYEVFSEQTKSLAQAKPDLLIIETMAEIREVKAALLAAKDNYTGPVIVQMTFSADGTTVTGTDVLTFLSVAESMGVDGIGLNCSVGPKDLALLAKILCQNTLLPISFKPNAGMPKLINRQTVFPGTIKEFVEMSCNAYSSGVNIIGGCCGTNPDYIKALSQKVKNKPPCLRSVKNHFFISSRTRTIDIAASDDLIIIGERINPTNRKKFQSELTNGNFSTLRNEAKNQVKAGAAILDINMGVPGEDEVALMKKAVSEIQEVVHVPLCLDSSNMDALIEGLQACAGKPIINSVNGDKEKLDKIFPIANRFGAAVIGLAADSKGIPKTIDERLKIAERILVHAKNCGFPQSDIILDYLTLSVSAMPEQTKETLNAIKASKQRWPNVRTVLGISNVSFGMPNRQVLNSTFLRIAKDHGLDMAILNPHSDWKIDDSSAKELLLGNDPGSRIYIEKYGKTIKKPQTTYQVQDLPADKKLYSAVVEGNREEISKLVNDTLNSGYTPLLTANSIILEALNEVGGKFYNKEYFLPQVIRSAEAAQAAFSYMKPLLKSNKTFKSGKIVLATVKGDVHDIGKNIVAAVFESHGWEVFDLGKNVNSNTIIETANRQKCNLIGLSALMTTTMLEMENVVNIRNSTGIPARIIIGGAPVTEKFSKEIKADGYAKNAVEAVEVAKTLIAL